ncbi:uncharacterized protein LOC128681275 isoform X3 [Plodia interpunctella]|uniref:uncharacterized protein LOC128681275 isoform X3 n=1 Tax=Plodia interpunctella TaxID=58824 RepID=UPI0023677304|nr:uncharacterized protein LOC128681275 isoform X3 [Plodia interpunctella]
MTLKSIFLRHCFFLALNIALILAQKPILRSGLPTSLLSRKPILRGGQPLLVEKPILRDGLDLDEDDKNDQLDSSADSYSVPNDRHYSDQRPRKLGGLAQDLSSEELQPTSDLKQELISVLLMDEHFKNLTAFDLETYSSSEYDVTSEEDGSLSFTDMLYRKHNHGCQQGAYEDCKYACMSTIQHCCTKYDCGAKLYKRMKKKAKEACRHYFS